MESPLGGRRALVSAIRRQALAEPSGPGGKDESRPRFFVFVHTDAKPVAIERALQGKMSSLTVTVFGRFKDFEDAFLSNRPDAVLAISPFLRAQKIAPTLQGMKGTRDSESYALVAAGHVPEGPWTSKVIGVVDVLGRNGTQDFVTSLLKTPDVKLKRVTKVEDLLSLLQFSAVDAILLPTTDAAVFKERSRLPLHAKELIDVPVGLPGVAVLNAQLRNAVIQQFLGLDAETNRIVGVEKWKVR